MPENSILNPHVVVQLDACLLYRYFPARCRFILTYLKDVVSSCQEAFNI
jgi:hypothetical protein